jgi:archaellum biogenesis ATPase FlaH
MCERFLTLSGGLSSNVVKGVFIVTPGTTKEMIKSAIDSLSFGIYPFYILLAIMLVTVKNNFVK